MKTNNSPTVVTAVLALQAMGFAASAGDARHYLAGIRVEDGDAGGAVIVATDGRRLGAFNDPKAYVGTAETWRLPPKLFKLLRPAANEFNPRWLKLVRLSDKPISMHDKMCEAEATVIIAAKSEDVIDNKGRIVGRGDALVMPATDTYPDWRKVIGEHFSPGPTLDGAQLKPFIEAARYGGGIRRRTKGLMTFAPPKTEKHGVMIHSESKDFVGILMPVALPLPTGKPKWFSLGK